MNEESELGQAAIPSVQSEETAQRSRHALLRSFDLIQVINLKERNDRRKDIEKEFERIGLSFDHPQIAFLEASRFENRNNFATTGARGCFDSHLRAMETARDVGARTTLILEDDCDFARNFVSLLPNVLESLGRTDWSIFYGGHLGWNGEADAESLISLANPKHGILGAHMMGWTAEAISLALPYLKAMRERPAGSHEGGPMHVDGAYNWFRRSHPHLQTWVASPALAYQRPSKTDIHRLRMFDTILGLRSLTAYARRCWRPLTRR